MDLEKSVDKLVFEGAPMAKGSRVTIEKMPLNKLKLNKNSRLNIDPDELEGLMQSIKEEGLLQPIGVVKSGTSYEICYGNRRFLAVSKLGMKSIPVIVHEKQKESDVDIKNLTENIQRRNISLAEVGRYITLLEAQGLSYKEAAVRLGVTNLYVKSCLTAYQDVPDKYRGDIEVKTVNNTSGATKTAPGKISITVAKEIINAEKSGLINKEQVNELFHAAKTKSAFKSGSVRRYARAMASGKKDYLEATPELKHIQLAFYITERDKDRLEKKYVNDGPFKTFNQLCRAVLRGEKLVQIPLMEYKK